jgi:hypothetical protein
MASSAAATAILMEGVGTGSLLFWLLNSFF